MATTPQPRTRGQERCIVHAFADSAAFGHAFAQAALLPYQSVDVHPFPDGETLVRVHPPTGKHAVLVRSLHHPNAKIPEILFAADALRRAGATRVTLLAPYLPYMRQDAVFAAGEPISQYVIGAVLHNAFDRVLTVEAHLHRTRRLSDVISPAARSVSAAPAIARWIQQADTQTVIVGPDSESEAWVRSIARAAGCSWIVGEKRRFGDHRVAVLFSEVPACSRAVIVDDIASSGGTIAAAARGLHRAGVTTVDAVVVHPILAPGARARLMRAGVRRLVSCDTIPHVTNGISVASLLAERREFH
jgi:ribose-phosphate pyrophosphokinase